MTPAQRDLAVQVLCEYRFNLLRTLKSEPAKAALTPAGREQYAADARLAAEAIQALLDEQVAA